MIFKIIFLSYVWVNRIFVSVGLHRWLDHLFQYGKKTNKKTKKKKKKKPDKPKSAHVPAINMPKMKDNKLALHYLP